jgi:hypothetical protein
MPCIIWSQMDLGHIMVTSKYWAQNCFLVCSNLRCYRQANGWGQLPCGAGLYRVKVCKLFRHSVQCNKLLSRKPPHCQHALATWHVTSVTQNVTKVLFQNLTFITAVIIINISSTTHEEFWLPIGVSCTFLYAKLFATTLLSSLSFRLHYLQLVIFIVVLPLSFSHWFLHLLLFIHCTWPAWCTLAILMAAVNLDSSDNVYNASYICLSKGFHHVLGHSSFAVLVSQTHPDCSTNWECSALYTYIHRMSSTLSHTL